MQNKKISNFRISTFSDEGHKKPWYGLAGSYQAQDTCYFLKYQEIFAQATRK